MECSRLFRFQAVSIGSPVKIWFSCVVILLLFQTVSVGSWRMIVPDDVKMLQLYFYLTVRDCKAENIAIVDVSCSFALFL